MSNFQSSVQVTDGAAVLPEPVQGGASGSVPTAQGEPRMAGRADLGAGPDEHSLLSRPAAPQYRRSLFRR